MPFYLLSIPLLIIVMWQDFKYRSLHILFPVLLFLFFLGIGISSIGKNIVSVIGINLAFLLIQYAALKAYFYFRYREKHIADRFIGRGDFLFFLAFTPAFSFGNFILIYLGGLVFSLLLGLSYGLITRRLKSTEIPLAGLFAVFFLFIFLINSLYNSPVNFLDNEWVLNLVTLWKKTESYLSLPKPFNLLRLNRPGITELFL